jgi:hypothetical protein
MSILFPPPIASHAEVGAWYDAHHLPRPKFVPPPQITREAASGWYNFDGGECRRGCRGWDGKSRRCDCGNSRVCWSEMDEHRYAAAC